MERQTDQDFDVVSQVAQRRTSRRQFLGEALLVGGSLTGAGSLLAACAAGSGDGSESSAKVVKLAIVTPLTGASARTGKELADSIKMVLNKTGNRVADYKIEPVWVDEVGGDAAAATQNYIAAISSGVTCGFMSWHASATLANMDVVARYKIPHFFGCGTSNTINEKFSSDRQKYGHWTTKGWAEPSKLSGVYCTALDAFIAGGQLTVPQKVAAMYAEDTDWGRSWAAGLKQQFGDAGWTVKFVDYFSPGATNHVNILQKYKEAGVSVMCATSGGIDSLAGFIKQSKEMQIKAALIADGLGYLGEYYSLTGPAVEGVLDMVPVLETPDQVAFRDEFEKTYGYKPSAAAAGTAHDLSYFLLKVLERCNTKNGKIDSESLFQLAQDELWTTKLTYDDGIIQPSFRYDDASIPDPVVDAEAFILPVVQYQADGTPKIVYPENLASTAAKFTF